MNYIILLQFDLNKFSKLYILLQYILYCKQHTILEKWTMRVSTVKD